MNPMQSKIIPIATYAFTSGDSFFIDANIWIFMYGRQEPGDRRIHIYSNALREILTKGCKIFVDVLILSEFINRYARIEHGFAKSQGAPENFKNFRNSSAFQPAARGIASACRSILKNCVRTESLFERVDIEAVLNDYESQHRDFNDQILSEICGKKKLLMISDDSDFRDLGVNLLTANKKLLSLPA